MVGYVKSMSIRPRTRAAAPLLVSLLLGDPNSAGDVAAELAQPELWRQALALSAVWGVVPQLVRRLRPFWADLEQDFRQRLQAAIIAATARSMLTVHRCSTVLEHFSKARIDAVAFKGVGLIGNLYGSPAERMVYDIDILIRGDDVGLAYKVLGAVGFSSGRDRLQNYVDPLSNWSLWLIDQHGIELDLHWGIGPAALAEMRPETILSRAEIVKTCGASLRVPAPLDSMMLTIQHSCAEFIPGPVVRGLCDLASWWNVQPERWNVDDAVKQAQVCGLTTPCIALWSILAHFDTKSRAKGGAAKILESASRQEREDARHLESLFQIHLRERIVGGDLLNALIRPFSINRNILLRAQRRRSATMVLRERRRRRGEIPKFIVAYQFLYDLVRVYPRRRTLYRALVRANRRYAST